MSDKTERPEVTGNSFIQRWSRRKLEQQREKSSIPAQQQTQQQQTTSDKTSEPAVRDADLPPIDTLQPDSEVSLFFSEGISEKLRQQALRKLFHFNKFNVVDGLDDYAEDYTIFQPLYNLYSSREDIQKLTGAISGNDDKETTAMDTTSTDAGAPLEKPQPAEESGELADNDIPREDKDV